MWKLRWKLISLTVAVFSVTSAQYHTIDSMVAVYPQSHDDNNVTFIESGHKNDSNCSGDKDEHLFKIVSINSNENHNNGIGVIVPDVSFPRPTSSLETKETSDTESRSPEQLQNSDGLKETSESKEPPENLSPENESSEHIPENPISQEAETNETLESSEVMSEENQTGEESPDIHPPPVNRSSEQVGVGPDITQEISDKENIQTTHGPVRGYRWPGNDEIIAYYDIPYGDFTEPFDSPVTAQSWLSVHEVTKHTKICPQFADDEYIGVMNCLTLSIFTPKDADNASVLFHVYDGYADYKSADPSIYGPDYLVPKGIILVLPNYRVGPMGFLCMHNETALGNAGLKDLSLALEWVVDNIHLFGGNPSNIVMSGDGAAGAYAGYLGICARSKHYIDKVITESGSALSHWALDRDPKGTAYTLAEIIRTDHSDGIIYNNTFAEVSLETILRAAKGMKFRPCIELDTEPLIKDSLWKTLQDKNINTTFMIGSASFAGAHEAAATTADFVAQINERFDILLPEDLVFSTDAERHEYALKLREQYFAEDNITINDIEEFSLWYTDACYLSPGIRLARPLVSAGSTVYMYEFAFVGSLNRELEALHRPLEKAVRGDLKGYLFHKDGTSVDSDSPEKHMIDLIVDLWVSFINNGKPEATNVEWHELTTTDDAEEDWLLINSEPEMKKGIHVERLRLWTSLYAQHFIDNSGARHGPHYLAIAIICFMANKLNYNRQ